MGVADSWKDPPKRRDITPMVPCENVQRVRPYVLLPRRTLPPLPRAGKDDIAGSACYRAPQQDQTRRSTDHQMVPHHLNELRQSVRRTFAHLQWEGQQKDQCGQFIQRTRKCDLF